VRLKRAGFRRTCRTKRGTDRAFTQPSSGFRGDSEALGEASCGKLGGFGLTYVLYASIQFEAIATDRFREGDNP